MERRYSLCLFSAIAAQIKHQVDLLRITMGNTIVIENKISHIGVPMLAKSFIRIAFQDNKITFKNRSWIPNWFLLTVFLTGYEKIQVNVIFTWWRRQFRLDSVQCKMSVSWFIPIFVLQNFVIMTNLTNNNERIIRESYIIHRSDSKLAFLKKNKDF